MKKIDQNIYLKLEDYKTGMKRYMTMNTRNNNTKTMKVYLQR